MKIEKEFIKFPFSIDADRLRHEIEALPAEAWQPHPTGFAGNSAVPLISVDGAANDDFNGPMSPTPYLKACPYMQQVLAHFRVPLARARLMRIAPGCQVPPHSDIHYHWFTRARIHVPIVTDPRVSFYCNGKTVHMAEGEAWVFDNWLQHGVENPTEIYRTHLVADTLGSAAFWSLIEQVVDADEQGYELPTEHIDFHPNRDVNILTERFNTPNVMPPAEMEWLAEDLLDDVLAANFHTPHEVQAFVALVRAFCRDWRMLWSLFGPTEEDWSRYQDLRMWLIDELAKISTPLELASNGTKAKRVLHARILEAALPLPFPESDQQTG